MLKLCQFANKLNESFPATGQTQVSAFHAEVTSLQVHLIYLILCAMTSWEQYFSALHLSHRVISQPGFGSCRSSLVLDASQLLSSQITQLDDAR